ncbi:MAG: DNA repair protein RecO [Candidatus Omnitrophica bacterium]|nr:DNA repair protein RecO [Candidatus Omnitrophota bacterium]
MAIKRDEAIVLKRVPLRETSLLVTFFTRHQGKIRGLAKGVRKEKNPIAVRFEPFTHLSVAYYEKLKSDTHLISDSAILSSHAALRSRLDLFAYASYFTELIDVLFGVHDSHPDIFDLLQRSFLLLEQAHANHVIRVFEIKVLEKAGLLPILTHCVLCGKKEPFQAFFSARQGGIICKGCDDGESGTIRISNGTLKSLLFFTRARLDEAVKLRLGIQTQTELERISSRFLQYRLEYPLRTSHFLTEIKPILKSI